MSNIDEIKELYNQKLMQVAKVFEQELKEIAKEERTWEGFDNPTKRQNGTVVTNPRDIVDTGEFVNGIEAYEQAVLFQAPHSSIVINGARTKNGSIPGRDIVKIARTRVKDSGKIETIFD